MASLLASIPSPTSYAAMDQAAFKELRYNTYLPYEGRTWTVLFDTLERVECSFSVCIFQELVKERRFTLTVRGEGSSHTFTKDFKISRTAATAEALLKDVNSNCLRCIEDMVVEQTKNTQAHIEKEQKEDQAEKERVEKWQKASAASKAISLALPIPAPAATEASTGQAAFKELLYDTYLPYNGRTWTVRLDLRLRCEYRFSVCIFEELVKERNFILTVQGECEGQFKLFNNYEVPRTGATTETLLKDVNSHCIPCVEHTVDEQNRKTQAYIERKLEELDPSIFEN